MEKHSKQLWYLAEFEKLQQERNGREGTFLPELQKAAFARLKEAEFPTRRNEEWRFTDVSPILNTWFRPTSGGARPDRLDVDEFLLKDVAPWRLVFVDGALAPELSDLKDLPTDVTVDSLSNLIQKRPEHIRPILERYDDFNGSVFSALNMAYFRDGVLVRVGRNVALSQPIHVLFVSHGQEESVSVHPRLIVEVESNAQAQIIESYVGSGRARRFTNPVVHVHVGDNAFLEHYKIQRESQTTFHVAEKRMYQGADSHYASHTFTFGGELVRDEIHTFLEGSGSECILNGLYMISNRQHVDHHTVITHRRPHTNSRELYKGIIDGQAEAIFSGKIHVDREAQKTDAIQSNQNLLLTDQALVDSKPQLEIYADDVRCTHGSTVGQLDDEGIFYLRTRGLHEHVARNLMIQAFAAEVTHRVPNAALRDYLDELVVGRLHDGRLD